VILFAGLAFAADRPDLEIVAPLSEVDHPVYEDASGAQLRWPEVKRLARGTDEKGLVTRRRWGRTVLGLAFAGATAFEVWGGVQIAQSEKNQWLAYPVFAQAAFTGACAVLTFGRMPGDVREDRAILVNAVNAKFR
jgi:hypothetical protein